MNILSNWYLRIAIAFFQMVLLAMPFRGYTVIEPVLGLVSSMVAGSILCFASPSGRTHRVRIEDTHPAPHVI
jgi:hypothetical protein